uniref:Uncharacterized protein n=1 Tax=Caulobacter phage BL57 TaxID=3348355 RepID=A0AB74ULT3_9VIRU
MIEYDACLTNWVLGLSRTQAVVTPDGLVPAHVVVGEVLEDRKGRYPNGRLIHTSALLTPKEGIQAGEVVQTLNSRYLLGRPADLMTPRLFLGTLLAGVYVPDMPEPTGA